MRARLHDDPSRELVDVYVYTDEYSARLVVKRGDSDYVDAVSARPVWEQHLGGAERPIFLRLPLDVFKAIEEAIVERNAPLQADRAVLHDDVADARKTRDRLLTIVERLTP